MNKHADLRIAKPDRPMVETWRHIARRFCLVGGASQSGRHRATKPPKSSSK